MDRRILTGGDGTSGQTGQQVRDMINLNFTDLYASMAADYVISISGSTITAKAREGSGKDDYSGSDAYTVIQAAITALTPVGALGTAGGFIFVCPGTYTLTNTPTISGWESIDFEGPMSQLMFIGAGWSTRLIQNTASKHCLKVNNNASVVIKNFYLEAGASAGSCLLFDDDGAISPQSVHRGTVDNINALSRSLTAPAVHLKNFMNISFPFGTIAGLDHDAICLEGTDATGNYGNSTFGQLKLICGEDNADAGLRITSALGNRPMNLCTFDLVECGQGKNGVYIDNGHLNTFKMVILESPRRPITITHGVHNTFQSGLIDPRGTGRIGIVSDINSGNNIFHLVVASLGDDPTDAATTIVDDDNDGASFTANEYKLQLDGGFDVANIFIDNPNHTILQYKRADDLTTFQTAPAISVASNTLNVATTQMVQFRAYYERDVTPFQILGSTMKAQTLGSKIDNASGTPFTLVDQRLVMCPVWLPNDVTLTGIGFIIRTNGSYTGDEYNGVGLYSYNESTGLCTRVALSTHEAALWAGGANTMIKKAFSSTYVATRGMYVVGALYNNSAQTTAPTIANTDSANAVMQTLDFTNSAKLCGTANGHIVLPTTINMSALTANAAAPWFMLY